MLSMLSSSQRYTYEYEPSAESSPFTESLTGAMAVYDLGWVFTTFLPLPLVELGKLSSVHELTLVLVGWHGA